MKQKPDVFIKFLNFFTNYYTKAKSYIDVLLLCISEELSYELRKCPPDCFLIRLSSPIFRKLPKNDTTQRITETG